MRYDNDWLRGLLHKPGYAVHAAPVASGLRHAVTEHDAGAEQVVVNEGQEGSAGRIEVRITRLGTRLLDADNLSGGVKWLLDGLRYEKLIPEDNPQAIRLIVAQRKAGKDERGTLIEIIYP
jgi:hypothetical protein